MTTSLMLDVSTRVYICFKLSVNPSDDTKVRFCWLYIVGLTQLVSSCGDEVMGYSVAWPITAAILTSCKLSENPTQRYKNRMKNCMNEPMSRRIIAARMPLERGPSIVV